MTEHELITVGTYLTRGDAEVARAVLAGGGVNALVQADDEGGLNPGFYRDYHVRLVVHRDDADEASAILAEVAG